MVAVLEKSQPSPGRTGLGIVGELLGTAVGHLPATVRHFHASTDDVVGTGTFTVQQSNCRSGRLLARALRMPRSVGDTPVALSITRERDGTEHWRRVFGDEVMASTQAVDGEYLVERIGALELMFVPTVEGPRLRFHHESVSDDRDRKLLNLFRGDKIAPVEQGQSLSRFH